MKAATCFLIFPLTLQIFLLFYHELKKLKIFDSFDFFLINFEKIKGKKSKMRNVETEHLVACCGQIHNFSVNFGEACEVLHDDGDFDRLAHNICLGQMCLARWSPSSTWSPSRYESIAQKRRSLCSCMWNISFPQLFAPSHLEKSEMVSSSQNHHFYSYMYIRGFLMNSVVTWIWAAWEVLCLHIRGSGPM